MATGSLRYGEIGVKLTDKADPFRVGNDVAAQCRVPEPYTIREVPEGTYVTFSLSAYRTVEQMEKLEENFRNALRTILADSVDTEHSYCYILEPGEISARLEQRTNGTPPQEQEE